MYYLAPTLDEAHRISDDLHDAGVSDWFLHVVSKDEAGLKREKLRSSNYIETLDLVRDGVIGAIVGLLVGLVGSGLLMYFQPFGPGVPGFVYLVVILVATLLGAWEGGMFGVGEGSQKLKQFRKEIDAGQYLLLIYTRKGHGEAVKKMMAARHPESRHVATDRHFVNPFAEVQRKTTSQGHQQTPAAS
jgi:hypothetical protein